MASRLEARSCGPEAVFRAFTRCAGEPHVYLLDVRPSKEFAKAHIAHSYCIRLTSNGQAVIGACHRQQEAPA